MRLKLSYQFTKISRFWALSTFGFGLFILLCFFIRPYPQAYIGAAAMRIIDIIVLCAPVAYLIVSNAFSQKLDKRGFTILCIFLLIFTFGLLSIANGYLRGVSTLNYRDLLDMLRYLQIPVFMLFGYFLCFNESFNLRNVLTIYALVIAIIFFFALFQRFLPGQFSMISNLYAPEHQASRILSTQRVTTIFGNPNTTSLMTCLFSSIFFGVLYSKSSTRKWKVFVLLAGCIVVVLLSGSRTGLISFILLAVIYFFLTTKHRLLYLLSLVFLLFLIYLFRYQILEVIRYFNYYLYVGIRIILLLDFDQLFAAGNTFFKRFSQWQIAIDLFKTAPIVGLGPLRGVVTSSTDNFYLYLLLRNGLVGLLLYLIFVGYSLKIAYSAFKARNANLRLLGCAYILQTAVILVMNFLIEAQIQNSAVYLHLPTLGILIGCYRKYIDE